MFEEHLQHDDCEATSRSKREKYRLILDTFCRIEHGQAERRASSHTSADGAGYAIDNSAAVPDLRPAASAAGEPTLLPGAAPLNSRGDDFVRMRDYLALADRVATLERLQARRSPSTTPRTLPQQTSDFARALSGPSHTTTQPAARTFGNFYTVDRATAPESERQSIVSGMTSHSTDYDEDFADDTQQILSEIANTGTGANKSTVHHMPLSPYPGGRQNEALDVQGAGRPKTSVTDSGYRSDVKGTAAATTQGSNTVPSQAQQTSQEPSGNWTAFLQELGNDDNFNADDFFQNLGSQ